MKRFRNDIERLRKVSDVYDAIIQKRAGLSTEYEGVIRSVGDVVRVYRGFSFHREDITVTRKVSLDLSVEDIVKEISNVVNFDTTEYFVLGRIRDCLAYGWK